MEIWARRRTAFGGLLADPNVAQWVGRLVVLVLVLLVGWLVGMLLSFFTRSLG